MNRWLTAPALSLGALIALAAGRCHAAGLLPPLTITTALSPTAGAVLEYRDDVPRSVTVQANFVYGSGGTTVDAYLQTSVDGATWIDIANFHFTTASAVKVYNLSSLTPITSIVTPTDGALASNTAVDGIIGPLLRLKFKSSGTYAGSTTLAVDVSSTRLAPQ